MNETMKYLVLIFSAYIIGSIPTAYIIGRLTKGIDIRNYGSGNVGATNAFRVLGKKLGILTLIIDILKGFLPVYFLNFLLKSNVLNLQLIAGLFLIIGHIYTIFLGFKGGKGVATAAGVFLAITPIQMFLTLIVFAIILKTTKYVSVGSIISAISYPIFIFIWDVSAISLKILSIAIALLIILKHKSNIVRLLNGSEKKIL